MTVSSYAKLDDCQYHCLMNCSSQRRHYRVAWLEWCIFLAKLEKIADNHYRGQLRLDYFIKHLLVSSARTIWITQRCWVTRFCAVMSVGKSNVVDIPALLRWLRWERAAGCVNRPSSTNTVGVVIQLTTTVASEIGMRSIPV